MDFHPDLDPANRETERVRFAAWVTDLAAECRDNEELLSRMADALPSDFYRLTGTGTTRRTYATRLGICIKVQREPSWADPLSTEEAEFRDEDAAETDARRRASNISELLFSTRFPQLAPRLYGALLAFGWFQRHPSVIVCETCRPLSHFRPDDRIGIFSKDMAIDDVDGRLWVFDKRFSKVAKPSHLKSIHEVTGGLELKNQLSNLGVSPDGRYLFLDRSDHGATNDLSLNRFTVAPVEFGFCLPTPAQDLKFSNDLLANYNERRKEDNHAY